MESSHSWVPNVGKKLATILSIAIAAPLAVGVGIIAGIYPALAIVVGISIILLPLLLSNAAARLAAVVAGALLVFQSSQEVGLSKLCYIAVAALCVIVSTVRVARAQVPSLRVFWPLVPATLAVLLFLGASAFVSLSNETPLEDWVRDVIPYVLLVTLPIVGIDAALVLPPRRLESAIGALGVIGALGLSLEWMNRRGASELGFTRIVLSTTTLVAVGFMYAVLRASLGPKRIPWLLAALLIMVTMLLSGSRTNLVLLVGFIGLVGARRKARISIMKATTMVIVTAASVIVLLPWAGNKVFSDPTFLSSRVHAAQLVLTGRAAEDMSFTMRQSQYDWATREFSLHPWLGTGPGHRYPHGALTLDTPLIVPAKFGITGIAILMLYFLVLVHCVRRCRIVTDYLAIHTAGRGWATILLALTPFGPWIEDKGFALAMTMLISAIVAHVQLAPESVAQQAAARGSPMEPGIVDSALSSTHSAWARKASTRTRRASCG
jgi:hypothetical protein